MARENNEGLGEYEFDPLAKVKEKEKEEQKGDKNINTDINTENERIEPDLLERLKRGPEKTKSTNFRGYYLDTDVITAIEVISMDREKGYKSFAVNEILREYFKRQGLL